MVEGAINENILTSATCKTYQTNVDIYFSHTNIFLCAYVTLVLYFGSFWDRFIFRVYLFFAVFMVDTCPRKLNSAKVIYSVYT